MRVEKGAAGYAITRAYQLDQLAHIMGLAKDENGNYYVATGVDEDDDLTPDMPGPGMQPAPGGPPVPGHPPTPAQPDSAEAGSAQ